MDYQYQTGGSSRRGERKRRLTQKRKKRTRLLVLIALIAVLVGLGAFGISRLDLKMPKLITRAKKGQEEKKTASTAAKKAKKAPRVERVSFLVVGASKVDGKEQAQGILFMVLNKTAKKLTAISVPENTLVDIPGLGFEKASLALSSGGMPTLVTTMKNFLEVPVEHQAKLEYENFKRYLDLDAYDSMIKKAKETDLSKKEQESYASQIAKINLEDARKVALPVKPLMMENKVYFEPVRESIDRLMEEVYGIKKKDRTRTARIVILNGCGIPGIAGKVTDKLVQNGYKITESKNADNFNYAVTQIISFKADLTAARKVREILGVGEVVRKRAPQDLVDLAVIIGKDYSRGQ